MTLEAWLVTDVGMVRDHNEDSAYMEPEQRLLHRRRRHGRSRRRRGRVARWRSRPSRRRSRTRTPEIDAFKKAPTDAGRRALVQLLQNAVLQAHQAVYQRGQTEPDKQGMGTTLDVVLVAGPEAFVAHVGDSRTYLIRDGRSSQITTDHTVAEVLVIEGKLTIEEAQVSPLRTILVNAIGVSADVGVEMAHVHAQARRPAAAVQRRPARLLPGRRGDRAAARRADKPGDALAEMVELAKTRGGHDNITGVAIQVIEVMTGGVPQAMDSESTDPVDTDFQRDDPTETAFLPHAVSGKVTEITDTSLRQTQPMRAAFGLGDTLPPPEAKPKEEPKSDGTPSADIATADTGRMAAAKIAAEEEAAAAAAAAAKTLPPKAEPAKPDEPKPEPAKPDEPKPEPAKPEESKPEPAKPDEPKPEPAKPEAAKPDAPDEPKTN